MIFLFVLPPLLYIAAFYTPIQNLRANLGTMARSRSAWSSSRPVAVAVAAHALIPGITWAAAFALGAIVAPPTRSRRPRSRGAWPFPARSSPSSRAKAS